jgi:hypothetical protein
MASATVEQNIQGQDTEERYAPGELTAAQVPTPNYGYCNENLPDEYQGWLKKILEGIAREGIYTRIEEIRKAAISRFYWRLMFDVYFDEKNTTWAQAGQGAGYGENDEQGDVSLSYPFGIYQSFGRAFISKVGIIAKVRFEAENKNPRGMTFATVATCMLKSIESNNCVDVFAEQVARLMWTDGRVGLYSRYVVSGSRYGYEDETHVDESTPEGLGAEDDFDPPTKQPRVPKGGARISGYGVLNLQVPIDILEIPDFSYLRLAYEINKSASQALYPHIADLINGGEISPGEFEYERQTRIAVNQGVKLLSQQGSTIKDLPTLEITWIRPSKFFEITDDDCRQWFQDSFPDGCRVTYVGGTYAESRNESMDDHWTIVHPIQGDGQMTPACGQIMIPIQDALIDMTDMRMETYLKAIPPIYGLKEVFDFAAMAKQASVPGQNWPVKNPPEGMKVSDCAWQPTPGQLPPDAVEFYGQLAGPLPQSMSGLFPAAIGEQEPATETLGGTLALRDASLGQQGVAWRAFRRAYCRSCEQLIRIEAYYKQAAGPTAKFTVQGHAYEVDLEDLRDANLTCVPASDQDFPETYGEQQRNFQWLASQAVQGDQNAAAIMSEKGNAPLYEKYLGIPGLVIPGAASIEKQNREIQQLLESVPVPTANYASFQQMNQMAPMLGKPPQDPMDPNFPPDALTKLFTPSVPIDPFSDDSPVEFQAGIEWMNSIEGQSAKEENPKGYLNVKLHLILHQQDSQKKAVAGAATSTQAQAAQVGAVADAKEGAEAKKDIAVEGEKRKTEVTKAAAKSLFGGPAKPSLGPGTL